MGNLRVSLRSSRSLTQKKNIRVSSLHVDLNQLFLQALENPKNLLDSVQLFQLFTFPYCIVGPTSMYIYTQVQCVLLLVFNNKNQGFSLFSLFTVFFIQSGKKDHDVQNYTSYIKQNIFLIYIYIHVYMHTYIHTYTHTMW